MPFTHSFTGVTPPPRFDDVAWSEVRVAEAPILADGTPGAFTQIQVIPIPLDPTPATADPISFTVTAATLESGYFRFAFATATAPTSPSPWTAAVLSPSPTVGPVWRPTTDEIADVTPAYTRGGFDDPVPAAGAEKGRYTAETTPTAAHVESLITAACDEVQGRVGVLIPERLYDLARTAAKWHVAAMIAAAKQPADTEDASGEYRSHITNFRATLDELTAQARMPSAMRLA